MSGRQCLPLAVSVCGLSRLKLGQSALTVELLSNLAVNLIFNLSKIFRAFLQERLTFL